jgi:Xaa-Pro aminopeptidase
MDFPSRQEQLRGSLAKSRLDVLLVSHLPNVQYLCGFTGSAGALLISESNCVFFTDGRYTEQGRQEVRGAKIVIGQKGPFALVAEWLKSHGRKLGKRIGIESESVTVAARQRLAAALPSGFHLKAAPMLVERIRMLKDHEEIDVLRKAVILGATLFDEVLGCIRPGVRESSVAAEMEYAARQAGAEAMSFPTIIASGLRSGLPHGRASAASIPSSGFVVCDFGVILAAYCSDQTRTVFVGRPSAEHKAGYEAVKQAQLAAVDAVRPGRAASAVDQAARKVLQKAKLSRFFTHSTGHGVGLEIHEAPRVAAGQEEVLRPGMVITIEPGIYIPGKWGIRIEDMIVVTEQGCEVLTPTTKELITL